MCQRSLKERIHCIVVVPPVAKEIGYNSVMGYVGEPTWRECQAITASASAGSTRGEGGQEGHGHSKVSLTGT